MTRAELQYRINELHEKIEKSVNDLEKAALKVQEYIYIYLLGQLEQFELSGGRFLPQQANFAKKIAEIETAIEQQIGQVYAPSVAEYLDIYSTIDDTHIALQKSYNDLVVEKKLLTPARMTIYSMAEHYLTTGVRTVYGQPVKYLLMQHVTNGITIKDSRKILEKWNSGETVGDVAKVPNLAAYSSQLARDAAYQHQGAINEIIAGKFGLKYFVYVGNIIRDSRPMCKHLIGLQRDIALSEMPALIAKYPQGLYKDTNESNFIQKRGGYNCRHEAFPVRKKKNK